MRARAVLAPLFLLLLSGTEALGQKVAAPKAQPAPAVDTPPVLRVEAGGPTAHVTALAFSPNGETLYAAGFDKVVRVWNLDAKSGRFVLDPFAYRVPISPGTVGVINTLAVSPDGEWLAVSGLGMSRIAAKSYEPGRVFPYRPPPSSEMLQQQCTIYLFNTKTHAESVLRGHAGRVLRMTFAPAHTNKPPLLVSAAEEQAGTLVGKVCLWDVSKAASLDDKGELVDRGALLDAWTLTQRPKQEVGLAVRHTGEELRQLHVAIAWSDGKLRIWDTEQKGAARVQEVADGLSGWNNTVAYLAGSKLLTGGATKRGSGFLQWWNDVQEESPQPSTDVALPPPDGFQSVLPRAVSLLSSRPVAGFSHAAVAARFYNQGEKESEFGLVLMDLAKLRPVATAALWRGELIPVLASSPRGQYLAVAGDKDHSIWVYSVQDLLRNLNQPKKLRSTGVTMRSVAFVQKNQGQDLGLLLSPAAQAQAGGPPRMAKDDLVFDFARRSLTSDPRQQGWAIGGPALDGWRVKGNRADLLASWRSQRRKEVEWEGPNAAGQLTLSLPAAEEIRDYALLPPSPFSRVPTLAVATWDPIVGQALIRLYHAKTGDWLRQFREQTMPILSLAASRDGRFLVSASEDRTVCIWTLADLDKVIGQQGTLWGVFVVKNQGNQLVVDRVDPDSAAQGKLEKGDVLEALIVEPGAKPRVFAPFPLDYFNALWEVKPGTKVALQIERKGAKQTVEVVIGQGVEDQRPLLSLFVPEARTQPREWIAWTPIGPYDASSKDVEGYLGWHFNPSKLEEPARFARADAYHDNFYKPLLLKPLLAHGDIHKAVAEIDKPPPVPKPELHLQVDSPGSDLNQEDDRGQILVRDPDVTLQLTITGPSLDKDQVADITWRLDNGQPQSLDLTKASGQMLIEKIRLPKERGIHTVQVQLRTHESAPQMAVCAVELRYQPPPPKIVFDEAWLKASFKSSFPNSSLGTKGLGTRGLGKGPQLRQTVEQSSFTVQAQVRPGLAGQEVKVSLRQNKGKPLPLELRVGQSLELQPGENVIELQAENKDALPGYEKLERDQKTMVLDFHPKPGPEVLVRTVEPRARRAEPVTVEPGQPVFVSHSEVRIRGTVTAPEKLKRVEVTDAKGKLLLQAEPGSQEFTLDQKVSLEPGEQVFRFRAETPNTQPTEVHVTLVYKPALPELVLTNPIDGLELKKGSDEPRIDVKGQFTPPDELVPFEVVVVVTNQGKTVPQEGGKAEIVVPFRSIRQGELQTLVKEVRLDPGINGIRVTVKNAWNESSLPERHISFNRPPRFLRSLESRPPDKKKPFTDLVAKVEAPTDLPPTRVDVDGREYPSSKVDRKETERGKELTTWEIWALAVPLHKGSNSLRFEVSNKEGKCLESLEVPYAEEQEKPALVRITTRPQVAMLDPEFQLEFRVESFTKLKAVELRQGNQLLRSIDVSEQKEEVGGNFVLKKSVPIRLREGTNNLRVLADNVGGQAHDDYAVSYVQPAVRLVVAAPAKEVQGAMLALKGHVDFRDAKEAHLSEKKAKRIRVYVNGFQQRPPEVEPVRKLSTSAPFSAEVLLNQRENQIEIECPDLPVEAGRKIEFTVTCVHPQPPATLHLLIVGVGVKPELEQNLVGHAFQALQTNGGEEGLRSAVFNRVIMHPYSDERKVQYLAGYVTRGHVTSALDKMRHYIDKRGSPSDVVLIYWLGRDLVQENEKWYLPTSESRSGAKMSDSGIAPRELLAVDRDVGGARVLLLDVSSSPALPAGPPSLDLPATHVAWLRYEWSKQEVPLPGLLVALEQAASAGKRISLRDMLAAADKYSMNYPDALKLTHNNLENSPLASLIVSQRP